MFFKFPAKLSSVVILPMFFIPPQRYLSTLLVHVERDNIAFVRSRSASASRTLGNLLFAQEVLVRLSRLDIFV